MRFLKHPTVNVDTTDVEGRTVLMKASEHGYADIVQVLLEGAIGITILIVH